VISVSSFKLEFNKKKKYYSVKTEEVVPCPYCGGLLRYRDSVIRNVKDLSSRIVRLLLRRLLCQVCKALHRELPDIIQPYKHYGANVIQAAIDSSEDALSCAADNSTIQRWKTGFANAESDINQRLSSVYVRTVEATVPIASTESILKRIRHSKKHWLPFVTSLLINSGHKTCTQFAFCHCSFTDKVNSTTKIVTERGRNNDKTIADTS
jgi:hypothetical protein